MGIQVLIIDDHSVLRRTVRQLLESYPDFEGVVEAANGFEGLCIAREQKPAITLVDIRMEEMNGIETTAQLAASCPETAILILSMYDDERYVRHAVSAGARGYVLKQFLDTDLVPAIRAVLRGETYFSEPVTRFAVS